MSGARGVTVGGGVGADARIGEGGSSGAVPERCPLCSVTSDGAPVCPGCGLQLLDGRIGQTVAGAYRIELLLGQGGIGRVYRATALVDGQPVAIKFLLDKWLDNHEQITRFSREAEALKQLRHPAIVELHDYGEHEGIPFMVMELVGGVTLSDELQLGLDELRLRRMVSILAQIAAALEAAHQGGFVHRDIKPENVMLQRASDGGEDRVKLLDFGIALMVKGNDSPRLTTAGEIRGTPLYMSPEQCMGRDIGPLSDVYSVGVILYQILTGEAPFTGQSPLELMEGHVNQPPPPLEEHGLRRAVPPTLEKLALWALNKRPEHRPTARQLRDTLERARVELALQPDDAPLPALGELPSLSVGEGRGERAEQATVAERVPSVTPSASNEASVVRPGWFARLWARLRTRRSPER